jgi:copper chaperone NosL
MMRVLQMVRVQQVVRVLAGALLLQAIGCAGAAGPPLPREIVMGVDVCEYCHMTVDDPGRAAQWLEPGGKALLFDEPGCLVAWSQARPGAAGEAFFGDAEGTGWILAAEACFIREGPGTGWGFDIVAYRSADAAQRVAAEMGGRVVSWQLLLTEGVAHGHEH